MHAYINRKGDDVAGRLEALTPPPFFSLLTTIPVLSDRSVHPSHFRYAQPQNKPSSSNSSSFFPALPLPYH